MKSTISNKGDAMNQTGQASLEYLLITSAFLTCLMLLIPIIITIHSTAVFGIDAINASSFAKQLKNKSNTLKFMGAGTTTTISSPVLTHWELSANSGTLTLNLHSKEISETKKFHYSCNPQLYIPTTNLENQVKIKLTKNQNTISITNS